MKKHYLLTLGFFWLIVSPLTIALLYNFLGTVVNLTFLKDIVIHFLIVFAILIFRHYKYQLRFYNSFLPIIFFLIIAFFASPSNYFAKIASIRQMINPYLLIILGFIYITTEEEYKKFLKKLMAVILFLLLFGFFERFFYLWQFVDIKTYYNMNNLPVHWSGYPWGFIEPLAFFHDKVLDINGIVRMVSTILDPINLGHILVFSIVCVYYNREIVKNFFFRYVILIGLLIGLILTFSKGAWFQLFLVLTILNKRIHVVFRFGIFLVSVPFIYFLYYQHSGIFIHFSGFINSLKSISFLGHGLAMTGNYAKMFGEPLLLGISDTYIGSILGQIGIMGLILWLIPFFFIAKKCEINHYILRLLVAQLIVAVLSENSFNLLAVSGLCLAVGGYYSVKLKEIKVHSLR